MTPSCIYAVTVRVLPTHILAGTAPLEMSLYRRRPRKVYW